MSKKEQTKKSLSTTKICSYFIKLSYYEKTRYPYIIMAIVLVTSLMPFINIIFPKYIIDCLLEPADNYKIFAFVLCIIGGNLVLGFLRDWLNEEREKDEDSLSKKIDLMFSEKAMKMKFCNTEKADVIELQKKAETGMSWYSGGIRGLSDCFVLITSSLVALVGVGYIITRISFVLVILAALSVSVNAVVLSKIFGAQQEVFEKTPKINKFYSFIYQRILFREYAKEMRIYSGNPIIQDKAMENAISLNKMDNQCAKKQVLWSMLGTITTVITYGVSYGWMGALALQNKLSISEFVMSITALDTLTNNCLNRLIQGIQLLSTKTNFMKSFMELMEVEDETSNGHTPFKKKDFFEVEFRNVFFKYPGSTKYIFKNLSLKIHNGEKLSIVGLNGAGKTTFVKLLCRLYDVDKGEILVNGINIQEYEYSQYIDEISVIFQDFKLFSLSLEDNILLGLNKTKEVNFDRLMKICKIQGWVNSLKDQEHTLLFKDYDDNGVEPSGGECQKLAITRAVARSAPMIILDEPTAALDPIAEYQVYLQFNEITKGKTCIYISHRLSSCKFCDKIVVFANGAVAEYGTHEELLAQDGIYAEMYDTQAEWYLEK